jgi:hypothetical protein
VESVENNLMSRKAGLFYPKVSGIYPERKGKFLYEKGTSRFASGIYPNLSGKYPKPKGTSENVPGIYHLLQGKPKTAMKTSISFV